MFQYLAISILSLSALSAQKPESEANQPPVFSITELSIERYTPANIPAGQLEDLARGMIGREFYLDERGGRTGPPIENMSLIGDTILLYDTVEYLDRMLASLKAMDTPGESQELQEQDPLVTFHYTPRYLSIKDTWSLLDGLTNNITVAKERSILVVRDYDSRVREIEALLERVDVPMEQILVTAYLVRATGGAEGAVPLPADLREHLGKLVPGMSFEVAGFAMLQTAVLPASGTGLQLTLTASDAQDDFRLSFKPTAYDTKTGSLSVESCSLQEFTNHGPTMVFSTSTLLRGGEYTVLGASGAQPIFVAVRLTRM